MKQALTITVLLISHIAAAQVLDYGQIRRHPRLLLNTGKEKEILSAVHNDTTLAKIHNGIISYAESELNTTPVIRRKEGKRLLAISRIALQRIFSLSYAYRMTGETGYADRAKNEIMAVCRFSDWNPSHFLDVGEMTMAVSIGFDWLYDTLSPEERKTICSAIEEKAFKAAANERDAWFYTAENNWNQVCNAGLVYGALATYEMHPEESQRIIQKSIESNKIALKSYAPDGGYPEGFGYWGYGTTFQIMMISALESALGHDAWLSDADGFPDSARFIQFMTAPSGKCFNFSDGTARVKCNLAMFWFAGKYKDSSLTWLERKYIENMPASFWKSPDNYFAEARLLPAMIVFASGNNSAPIMPREKFWRSSGSTPVFIYKGGWSSGKDSYLAVKGGSPSTSHAHMDAGSFVYEKDGTRWSIDLGNQSYISLESRKIDLWNKSQGSQRWQIFRHSNEAHSTLTMNGEEHRVESHAEIIRTYNKKNMKGVSVDLTSTFGELTRKTLRTIYLDGKDNLNIKDEVCNAGKPNLVQWVMTTPAEAEITGNNTIRLTKDGNTMILSAENVEGIEMHIWDNTPANDYEAPNPDTRRVGFTYRMQPGEKRIFKVSLKQQK